MSEHAEEMAALDEELEELQRERRAQLVRLFADEFGLRPEAHRSAIALIDWDPIEAYVDGVDENDVRAAMAELVREHDYLFIPELIHTLSPGSSDAGQRSHPSDEHDEPQGRTARDRIKRLLSGGHRGYRDDQIAGGRA